VSDSNNTAAYSHRQQLRGVEDSENYQLLTLQQEKDAFRVAGYNPASECAYKVKCTRALCVGFNAKENLKNMNQLLFKRLLFPLTFPQEVIGEIGQLNARLDTLDVSATELRTLLLRIEEKAWRTSHR
jgi:hypothetical protein